MHDLDKRLLTAIQGDFPADERPFDVLAARLGVGPDEVLARVGRMQAEGIIRRIGPIFDSRRLGYASTLVAARVPPERLAEIAGHVSLLPGVTHNYSRQHAYNLWFTLTAPSAEDLERTLDGLRRETGIVDFHSLPALKVYKIRVQFDMADEPSESPAPLPLSPGEVASLTEEQKELVRLIQDGLAVEREPLATAAARLGWPTKRVVEQIREWMASGVIRRFGTVVRHHKLGYSANGMAVFRVPPEGIDEAGRRLAKHKEVSHCYRRPPLPDFAYNLFAMIHGRSEEAVRQLAALMAGEAGAEVHDVLFSLAEFKKVSMRYFVDPG
jgi:DNA-binding Lrp family transcriptional regulator